MQKLALLLLLAACSTVAVICFPTRVAPKILPLPLTQHKPTKSLKASDFGEALLEIGSVLGPHTTGGAGIVQPRFMATNEYARTQASVKAHEAVQAQTAHSTTGGADPWWLKNVPWWMPPPPSWGPMPPQMFEAYYQNHEGVPPISTANTYPLFKRHTSGFEPPDGSAVPVKHTPFSEETMLAPRDPRPLTAKNHEENPPGTPPKSGPPEEGAGQGATKWDATLKKWATKKPAWAFIETDVRVWNAPLGAEGGKPVDQSISGPVNVGEHLLNYQTVGIPKQHSYDPHHYYDGFWRRKAQFDHDHSVYTWRFAPSYPPNVRKTLRKVMGDDFQYPFRPKPNWFFKQPTYPSKYNAPTVWQMNRLAAIRKAENNQGRVDYLRKMQGMDIPAEALVA